MEKMNDELPALLAKLLKDKQWIILTESKNKREMEVTSNIGKLDDRRQLLGKADHTLAIEIQKKRKHP